MEPKAIVAIIGGLALFALIIAFLCRHYKKSDGSVDRGPVGKIILFLLFWWVLIFVVMIRGVLNMMKK